MFDWIEFMAVDVEVLPRFRKRVANREAAGLCVGMITVGETTKGEPIKEDCGGTARRRGLCANCHHAYRMQLLQTPKRDKRKFENEKIRDGEILPPRQGQKKRRASA